MFMYLVNETCDEGHTTTLGVFSTSEKAIAARDEAKVHCMSIDFITIDKVEVDDISMIRDKTMAYANIDNKFRNRFGESI